MLIALPPSESKTGRLRGRRLDVERLSFPALNPHRRRVIDALSTLAASPDAAQVLGVSPSLTAELARNGALASAHTLPALACYSGVLYDALSYHTLDPDAARRANRRLVVVSALYGAVRPKDPIVPYRLSMAVNMPGIGPLASSWKPLLTETLGEAVGRGLVVDCRSSTYAAAWSPNGPATNRWVQVAVPGATHMAKHTRGLVARTLCQTPGEPRTPAALADLLAAAYDIALTAPNGRGRPWILSVRPA